MADINKPTESLENCLAAIHDQRDNADFTLKNKLFTDANVVWAEGKYQGYFNAYAEAAIWLEKALAAERAKMNDLIYFWKVEADRVAEEARDARDFGLVEKAKRLDAVADAVYCCIAKLKEALGE